MIGEILADLFFPLLEEIAPHVPGEFFPYFFNGQTEALQRAMLASILVSVIAGFLGSFLLVRNLAMIGDGLAHVASFRSCYDGIGCSVRRCWTVVVVELVNSNFAPCYCICPIEQFTTTFFKRLNKR